MFVDLVGQLKRRYLATAFSSFVGSLTSCRTQANRDECTPTKATGKVMLYYNGITGS